MFRASPRRINQGVLDMRKVLLALLLIAPAAYAQPKTSLSVFLSQVNIAYSSTTGHHWYSDYGAGVRPSSRRVFRCKHR